MIIRIEDVGKERRTEIGVMRSIDYMPVIHNNGKLFVRYLYDNALQKLGEDMRRNVADNNDNFVCIEGGEGSGKSNLAYWVCKAYDPTFNIEDNYVYDFDTFKEKISSGDINGKCFWMDEMSNLANNRDWNSTANKHMIEFVEMMRSKSIMFCCCIPHHERLDVYLRENRIRYLLKCSPLQWTERGKVARGTFEISKRNDFGMIKHVGYGCYDQIPPEDKKIYERIKIESQQKKIDEIVNGGDDRRGSKYKKMYEDGQRQKREIMLRMQESGIDNQHIMDLFGYTDSHQFYNQIVKARHEREAAHGN